VARNVRIVILLTRALAGLPAAERYALELLTDLSRLVPVDDPSAGVVRLELSGDGGRASGANDIAAQTTRQMAFEASDGVVRISRSELRAFTAIATAERERRAVSRDKHGRVPSSENALVQAGLDREPVLSLAAARFAAAVVEAAGERPVRFAAPWPHGRRWAAAFTHDLDVVALWPLFASLRMAELARKRDGARLSAVMRSLPAALANAPVQKGVDAVLEAERGLVATWFILCGTPNASTVRKGDLTYRPESRASRDIIEAVSSAGHEVALHGSFETFDRDGAFAEQRVRLARITGRPVAGVRQHFLRMRPGRTELAMHAAGFRYDSTVGFADRNGFRTGAADVLPVWEPAVERASGFLEMPFCFMDRSLSKYRGEEDPSAWTADALALADTCRDFGGLWTGIWHPNVTLAALGYPGAIEAYGALVDGIVANTPYVATLDTIARWRTARRSIRVRTVRADGTVEPYLVAPGLWDEPLHVEDAAKNKREVAR
jgi:hypothetical protein